MKKTRTFIVLLTALALMLTLTACGQPQDENTPSSSTPTTVPTVPTEPPVTAQSVYASLSQAMETTEATRMYTIMAFDLSYTAGEGEDAVTEKMAYSMTVDVAVSEDPFGSYTISEIDMESTGYSFGYDVEAYTVIEEDYVVIYTKVFDSWTRVDSEMTVEQFLNSDSMTEISTDSVWLGGEAPADLTMDENTIFINDREVYVLHCSVPGEGMEDALGSTGLDTSEGLDTLTIPVTYYVDVQDYTLMRMEISGDFMEQTMAGIMAESVLGTDAEGMSFTLEIADFYYDLSYGPQSIPAVPQEAYDYLENQGDSSGGLEDTEPVVTGPLVLKCGEEQILITPPEGWTGEFFTEETIWVYSDDFTLVGDFSYVPGSSYDDILTAIENDADSLKQFETYISHGEGPAVEGYETMQVVGQGECHYYAWREVDGGWLAVSFFDYTTSEPSDTLLLQMLDLMSPYTE